MRKLIFCFVLLGIALPSMAANVPATQRKVSPNGKYVASLKKSQHWALQVKGPHGFFALLDLTTRDVEVSTYDDAWGIYDLTWSPDSRLILFVFRPFASQTISHSRDSFGIFDPVTEQWTWIAGAGYDNKDLGLYGIAHPKFQLSWNKTDKLSFVIPGSGKLTVDVSKVRQQFAERQKQAYQTVKRLIVDLSSPDWVRKVEPILTRNPQQAKYVVEQLSAWRASLRKATKVDFGNYRAKRYDLPGVKHDFEMRVWLTPSYSIPIHVSAGRIIDIAALGD